MKEVVGDLSPRRSGAEVLAAIARARADGRLTWSSSGGDVHIEFIAGRPARAGTAGADEGSASARNAVVSHVRSLARAMSGHIHYRQSQESGLDELGIDTTGEAFIAVATGLEPDQLRTLWQVRGSSLVTPTPAYPKLKAVAAKLGLPTVEVAEGGAGLGDLASECALETQRLLAAILFVGGFVESKPKTVASAPAPSASVPAITADPASVASEPPPADPKLAALFAEIEDTFQKSRDQTYYELLGVDAKAPVEEIRRAYLALAKRWHTDSFAGFDLGPRMARVEAIFRRIGEANAVLSNAEERKSYDFMLERKSQGLPTDGASILEAEALFKKAVGLVRRGQAAAALPMLQDATRLNAGEAEFLAYLGFALYNANGSPAVAEARGHLQKALHMRDTLDVAHEFLGRIAHAEGDIEGANRALRKALELNPKNREAERELRLITMRSSKGDYAGKKGGGLLDRLLKRD